MTIKPLNGAKTHPLTESAKETLRRVAKSPVPVSLLNSGIVNRLLRGELVEDIMLPSPFVTYKGNIRHLRITEVGRAELNKRV